MESYIKLNVGFRLYLCIIQIFFNSEKENNIYVNYFYTFGMIKIVHIIINAFDFQNVCKYFIILAGEYQVSALALSKK